MQQRSRELELDIVLLKPNSSRWRKSGMLLKVNFFLYLPLQISQHDHMTTCFSHFSFFMTSKTQAVRDLFVYQASFAPFSEIWRSSRLNRCLSKFKWLNNSLRKPVRIFTPPRLATSLICSCRELKLPLLNFLITPVYEGVKFWHCWKILPSTERSRELHLI